MKTIISSPTRVFRQCFVFLGLGAALLSTSCVSLVTPEKAPITPAAKTASPVGIVVSDHRTNTASLQKDRYYGRCRLAYGIPSPILDPKMSLAERFAAHAKAGFAKKGMDARTAVTAPFGNPNTMITSLTANGAKKVLLVRMDDIWIDFANPLYGKESILYFDATVQVYGANGKLLASTSRKFERNFRYDVNDSLFNQAVLTLQPEFTQLINQSSIMRALAF